MDKETFEKISKEAEKVAKHYKSEKIDDYTMSVTGPDGKVTFVHFDDPIKNFESLSKFVALNISLDEAK